MNHQGGRFFTRATIVCASVAVAIFSSAPIFAQPKPIVINAQAIGEAASIRSQFTISQPGSYVLATNIKNKSANADSVKVTASNVTIDLQGFSITSATTTGAAINAAGQSNVVIRNGIIMGFGGAAIITGNAATISGITATGNGSGISCGIGCLVRDNVIQGNTGVGMTFSDATSGYQGNVLQGNNSGGAQVTGGTSLMQNLCNGVAC